MSELNDLLHDMEAFVKKSISTMFKADNWYRYGYVSMQEGEYYLDLQKRDESNANNKTEHHRVKIPFGSDEQVRSFIESEVKNFFS